MKKLKNNISRLPRVAQNILPATLLSLSLVLLSCFSAVAQAVQAEEIAMADIFRSEGKIYVVVAVILLLFAGLVFYAFSIDRKVSRLEKELEK